MNKVEESYVGIYKYICRKGDFKHYGVQYFYKNPSQAKIDAELAILKQMYEDQGYRYKVLGGSIYLFTCAYLMNDKNGDTYLKVFTKNKEYKIPYQED